MLFESFLLFLLHNNLYSNLLDYRLFKQYLVMVLISQMGAGMFRFLAVMSRDLVVANTAASFGLLVVLVFGGFILSHGKM